jgi:hypothetical protein
MIPVIRNNLGKAQGAGGEEVNCRVWMYCILSGAPSEAVEVHKPDLQGLIGYVQEPGA